MDWITPRRVGIIGSVGATIFFAGFAICKLAGSEPGVSWKTGVFDALGFGAFLVGWLLCLKWNTALNSRLFYGETKRKSKEEKML